MKKHIKLYFYIRQFWTKNSDQLKQNVNTSSNLSMLNIFFLLDRGSLSIVMERMRWQFWTFDLDTDSYRCLVSAEYRPMVLLRPHKIESWHAR